MIVARGLDEIDLARAQLAIAGRKVAFVPTMGALHAGHRSLMALAHEYGDAVIVSIFVNPLQFGPDEDYARYPRQLESDLEICRAEGVAVVFTPSVSDLYPAGRQVSVNAGALGSLLEGASRPGHFDGVLTVVTKFFNIVRPDVAIFGKKDAQQLAVIRRMVTDLNSPVRIVGAPIVREPDGLALSSRNRYLAQAERTSALALSQAMRAATEQLTPSAALHAARSILAAEPGVEVDYLSIVQPGSLAEISADYTGPALILVAARVGTTRLIDNADLVFAPLAEPEPVSSASGSSGSWSSGLAAPGQDLPGPRPEDPEPTPVVA
ncbi:MAG TPA: pantoate--beta-alanine ligase [Microlunatus sp.]|nr:pantoate--beta-alanine ligase [Microlunatus sp.]